MPKITAATVAEHHARQRQQVLSAALILLAENGGTLPTLGQVAAKVGLARSSVYQYVSSKTDLLAQLLADFFEEWSATVGRAMAAAPQQQRLAAYIDTNLKLFSQWSRHALMDAAAQEPAVFAAESVRQAHESLRPQLIEALIAAGLSPSQAEPFSRMLDASIHTAAKLIMEGSDELAVRDALHTMVSFSN